MDEKDKKRQKWLEGAIDKIAGGLFGEAYKAKKKKQKELDRARNPT